jgi:hypothetical protein
VHRGQHNVCHVCGRQLAGVNSLRIHLEVRHGIMPPLPGRKRKNEPGEPRAAPPCYFCARCGKQAKGSIHFMFVPKLYLPPLLCPSPWRLDREVPVPGTGTVKLGRCRISLFFTLKLGRGYLPV